MSSTVQQIMRGFVTQSIPPQQGRTWIAPPPLGPRSSWWTRIVLDAADYPAIRQNSGWTDEQTDMVHRALSDHADEQPTPPTDDDIKNDLFRLSRSGVSAEVAVHSLSAGLHVTEIVDLIAAGDLDEDVVAAMAALRTPPPTSSRPGMVGYQAPTAARLGSGKSLTTLTATLSGAPIIDLTSSPAQHVPAAFRGPCTITHGHVGSAP